MFKMILTAIVALGLGSVAYAQAGGAPTGDAPATETPKTDKKAGKMEHADKKDGMNKAKHKHGKKDKADKPAEEAH